MNYKNRFRESSINATSNNHSQATSTLQYHSSSQQISHDSLVIFILFVIGIIIIACGLLICSINQAKNSSQSVFDKDIHEAVSLEMGLVKWIVNSTVK